LTSTTRPRNQGVAAGRGLLRWGGTRAGDPAEGATAIRTSFGTGLIAPALWLAVLALSATWPAAAAATPPRTKAAAPPPPSEQLAEVADWVIASGDNRGLPFAVVDKVAAEVFVFDADGQLKGAAPALVGLAHGDDSTPGVGDRELSNIPPEERTTPAGRFMVAFGPSGDGKTVLWVDYATAISLHAVIDTNRKEQRPKRLASPTPDDNRITFGCINVPTAFYRQVIRSTFKGRNGVMYILPESKPLTEVLPAFEAQRTAASTWQAHTDPSFPSQAEGAFQH
jgi:hypothetical protein